jgi:tetratricopeptide (TPR) repeat protein
MTDDAQMFDADLPADVRALLADAEAAYSEPERAERALRAALDRAPDNLALRIAAYTFYFYAQRYDDAIPHAEACLAMAAAALGVPADWQRVGPESTDFSGFGRPQRLYLKSLVALGYCRARLGDHAGGEAILRKAASLDPKDQVGAGRLADVSARGGLDMDEDDEDGHDDSLSGAAT